LVRGVRSSAPCARNLLGEPVPRYTGVTDGKGASGYRNRTGPKNMKRDCAARFLVAEAVRIPARRRIRWAASLDDEVLPDGPDIFRQPVTFRR
jgi:hypothetical protein